METTLKVRKILGYILPTWSTPVVLDGASIVQAEKTVRLSWLQQFKVFWKSLWAPPVPLVGLQECQSKLEKARDTLKAKQAAHVEDQRSVIITFDERDAA